MRFFVDNNIAPKLARGFNQFVAGEHEVIHLRDRFEANTSDVEWMRALGGENGWIIISGDVAIGRNRHEVEAWKSAGHTIFFLKAGWTNIEFCNRSRSSRNVFLKSLRKRRAPVRATVSL